MLKRYFVQLGIKYKLVLFVLIISGIFLQVMTMFRSGLNYPFGLGFWGPNGHDGIWHLALVNQVLNHFPPLHPVFAGESLTNYHYFFDLFLALISKITFISSLNLYFQIFPLITALLLGFLSFIVGYLWKKDFWVGFWLAFLNYFAGSFGYFITLLRSHDLGGESLFWSMQSISTQINPPYALSLVLILLGLSLLLSIEKPRFWQMIFISILFGILINIKVYAGIICLFGLFIFSLVKFKKGNKSYLLIFLISSAISAVIYLITNIGSQSLLVFQPLWFIHSMVESVDRLYLPRLAVARYSFLENGAWGKLIFVEVIGIAVFIIGNAGTRIFGLYKLVQNIFLKKTDGIEFFVIPSLLVSLLIPLFFVQKGTSWNTIQFFYYFLFFINFYTALFLSSFLKTKISQSIKMVLVGVFILLTIPTTYSSLKDYFGYPPPSALPSNEIKALDFLKSQPDGIVLTYSFDKYVNKGKTPFPLYLYATSAYVSAFSGKITFLEDEMNLDISGYPWKERREEVLRFFNGNSPFEERGFLVSNKIRYLYLVNGQNLNYSLSELGLELIYNQDFVKVYRVLW